MLCSNCSSIPWWQRPQVVGMFARIDARSRIVLRQHAVRGVAARARRRHGQAALHQPLAVDALGVVLDDLVLRARVAHAPPSSPRGGSARTELGNIASGRSPTAGRPCRGSPCVPWHSLQVGRVRVVLARPARRACCVWYCWPTSAWQDAQSTFLVIVSQGRTCDALTSEWHWLQAIFAWRDPATSSAFT